MSTPETRQGEPLAERPRIDSLFVADFAEAINGKIYAMGGGWDTIHVVTPPGGTAGVRFALAGLLRVPWNDTNREFAIRGTAETADGEPLGWRLDGQVEAGRRPGARRGSDTIIAIAGPVQFELEEVTDFVIRVRFADDERTIALHAVAGPPVIVPGG